jgi:hypothetical protein
MLRPWMKVMHTAAGTLVSGRIHSQGGDTARECWRIIQVLKGPHGGEATVHTEDLAGHELGFFS